MPKIESESQNSVVRTVSAMNATGVKMREPAEVVAKMWERRADAPAMELEYSEGDTSYTTTLRFSTKTPGADLAVPESQRGFR